VGNGRALEVVEEEGRREDRREVGRIERVKGTELPVRRYLGLNYLALRE